MIRRSVFLVGLSFVTACGSIPRGSPLQQEIVTSSGETSGEYKVYAVNRALLPVVTSWPRGRAQVTNGWIKHSRGPVGRVIGPGDKLSIGVWDNEDNSLLTSPGQKIVNMSEMTVAPDGTIFIPYLERIYLKGQTPEEARETIQKGLEGIVPSAQVQLSMVSGRMSSVDLVGGVGSPGNYPLPDRDFSVLNLVSLGGGVSTSLRNPQIRLMRNGRVYATSIANLYSDPRMDTTLRGGDKVIIEEDKRYFLSLGAAGEEKTTYFDRDRLSAIEAITLIGGLADSRADPKGILILRHYSEKAVRTDGKGPENERVIFTIDLTKADGLFSAGEFEILPGDLVLATESPITSVQTIFSLIGTGLGVINKI